MAAIKGLRALKEKCDVTVYSDSRYLILGRTNEQGTEHMQWFYAI
nr:hypothetical protein [Desulfosporosinus sp. OT]